MLVSRTVHEMICSVKPTLEVASTNGRLGGVVVSPPLSLQRRRNSLTGIWPWICEHHFKLPIMTEVAITAKTRKVKCRYISVSVPRSK